MSKFAKVVRAEIRGEDRVLNSRTRFRDSKDIPKRVPGEQDYSYDPLYIREKKKWEDLGVPELRDRLQKMKNPKKLKMFIVLSEEHNHKILYDFAINKVRELGYNWLIPKGPSISRMMGVRKPGQGAKKSPRIRKVRVE